MHYRIHHHHIYERFYYVVQGVGDELQLRLIKQLVASFMVKLVWVILYCRKSNSQFNTCQTSWEFIWNHLITASHGWSRNNMYMRTHTYSDPYDGWGSYIYIYIYMACIMAYIITIYMRDWEGVFNYIVQGVGDEVHQLHSRWKRVW